MYRGYVKLWRKVLDAGWFRHHQLWVFWSWCMVKATHKEIDQRIGMQTVHLMPGDFVFGRKVAAEELCISEQSIRTILKSLKKSKNLTIKVTNKFSVISLTNWDIYASGEVETNHQTNQPLTNNQPATNQQLTTNKNNKNVKKNIFIIPTVEEVAFYCLERGKGINAQVWMDYYVSNGWMVGRNKMRDWKASIRTWETRGGNDGTGTFGRAGTPVKKAGRASSDGQPYPVDHEF